MQSNGRSVSIDHIKVTFVAYSSQFPHEHINCLYLCSSTSSTPGYKKMATSDNIAFQIVDTGNFAVCELCKRSGKSLHGSLKIVSRTLSTHHIVFFQCNQAPEQ